MHLRCKEGKPPSFSSHRALSYPGEMQCLIVMLLTELRNHTPRPVGAVFLYSVIKLVPYILRIVSFLYVYVLYHGGECV